MKATKFCKLLMRSNLLFFGTKNTNERELRQSENSSDDVACCNAACKSTMIAATWQRAKWPMGGSPLWLWIVITKVRWPFASRRKRRPSSFASTECEKIIHCNRTSPLRVVSDSFCSRQRIVKVTY